jgi:hypothetical protein
VHRQPSPKIWKSESALSIAAVRGADQVEKRFVLGNRKQLALAEHPTARREVPGEHPNFSNVRLRHDSFS